MCTSLKLYYANITTFGRKASCFVREVPSDVQIIAFVETHLSSFDSTRRMLRKQGWMSVWTGAQRTQNGGTSGGVVVASRIGSVAHAIAQADGHTFNQLPGACVMERSDWAFVVVPTPRLRFVLVVLYLTSGLGVAGANVDKLSQVGAFLGRLRLPFIVIGDWNLAPRALVDSSWPDRVGGIVVTPTDVDKTCLSKGGSLIDYMVVHPHLLGAVNRFERADPSPWAPHVALGVEFNLAPVPVLVRSLWSPKPFKLTGAVSEYMQCSGAKGALCISDAAWNGANHVGRLADPPEYMDINLAFQCSRHDSEELGHEYYRWCSHFESAIQLACPQSCPSKHVGRGTWPKFVRRVMDHAKPMQTELDVFASVVLTVLQTVVVRLREMLLIHQRGRTGVQQVRFLAVSLLRSLHGRVTQCTDDAVRALLIEVQTVAARVLDGVQPSEHWTQHALEKAQHFLQRLDQAEQCQQRATFAQWIAQMATSRIGALHRWTKQDSQLPEHELESLKDGRHLDPVSYTHLRAHETSAHL
eukprot:15467835-Alexandrium_andersonii.AAC.1